MGNVVSGLQVGSFLILCMITWGRTEESKSEPRSVDAHRLTIEGQAWPGEGSPYGRLPARMQGQVRPELWQMGQYAAGLSVRFISNSAGLGAAWDQVGTEENAYNLTGIAQSGMDLYVREGDEWMWIGQAVPTAGINQAPVLVEGLDGQFRQYRLYLPLFSQVENLKIWVHKGEIGKMPPRVPDARRAPIVFYGTSITQGASASRPGLTYSAIIGRKLDRPVFNLGFSGQGPMDLEVAELLAELDPAAYVVECTANMTPEEIQARTVPFVRILRAARPQVPIVLVESPPHGKGRWLPAVARQDSLRGAYLLAGLQALVAEGEEDLYFVEGDSLRRPDREGLIDGVHPNDLGMELIAERVMSVLVRAIKE